MYSIEVSHNLCIGHRLHKHQGKCKHLHGHNYKVNYTIQTSLYSKNGIKDLEDTDGMVIDYSIVKNVICQYIEDTYDHTLILALDDPMYKFMEVHGPEFSIRLRTLPQGEIPTAENMARAFRYLAQMTLNKYREEIGSNTIWTVSKVEVYETATNKATYQVFIG